MTKETKTNKERCEKCRILHCIQMRIGKNKKEVECINKSCPCHHPEPSREDYPSKLAIDITEIILNKEAGWSIRLEEKILSERTKAYNQGREDERKDLVEKLQDAIRSADNLAHIQKEPQSNQFIHLKGHILSIINLINKKK